jgi:hypothetical protein
MFKVIYTIPGIDGETIIPWLSGKYGEDFFNGREVHWSADDEEKVALAKPSKSDKLRVKCEKLKTKLKGFNAVEKLQRLNDPEPLTVAEAAHLSGMGPGWVRRYFRKIEGVKLLPSSITKRGKRPRFVMTIPVRLYEREEVKWTVNSARGK